MERCPKCNDYTLSYDPLRGAAVCTSHGCDYIKTVSDTDEYFKVYVTSKLNWDNYCASTPLFIRQLRGTLSP